MTYKDKIDKDNKIRLVLNELHIEEFNIKIRSNDIEIIKIERPKYEVVEEIDIDKITYFDEVRDLSTWINETLSDNQRSILNKIRELIKAVKQLNKKIKE